MALRTYRAKRDFALTPEPKGGERAQRGARYVIQKHAARRLHYDLRLELDGAMKSWAVTRGPSLVPGEKRLAVQVEDHPIEYNDFEGSIPKGQYGGGTVMIWDRGEWRPEGDAHRGLQKGHLDFVLEGEKLKGRWHLVRMRKKPGEKHDPWLLIKASDADARDAGAPDILEEEPLSVVTGRSIAEIAEGKAAKRRKTAPLITAWSSNRKVHSGTSGADGDPPQKPRRRQSAKAAKKAKKKSAAASASANPRRKSPAAPRSTRRKPAARKARRRRSEGTSGKTGRRPASPARAHRPDRIPGARAAPLPEFVPPCLATLHAQPPSGEGWTHEIKFDGYRIAARLERGSVALLTRRGLDWTAKFAPIAAAIAALPADTAIIDGEIVVENGRGLSDFSELQADLSAKRTDRLRYYVFDLLYLDGFDLTRSPLRARKAALRNLLAKSAADERLRFSESFDENGATLLEHACRLNLEGIVSKRADTPYRSGRGDDWIKTKCSARQEFVIAGYAPSSAKLRAIGSIILGYYENGALHYAGRVGTGFSEASAKALWRRLDPLRRARTPFAVLPPAERRRDVRWVAPQLVAEIDFRGWTADRLVRHGSFKGLREDKRAEDVVLEASEPPAGRVGRGSASMETKSARKSSGPNSAAAKKRPARRRATPSAAAAPGLRLTHPERVYWEDIGLTKQGLAGYYASVWDWMAPHVVDRPLSLLRCPDGVSGECFFQRHIAAGIDAAHLIEIPDGAGRKLLAIANFDGLLALVQAGVLEIHAWGAKTDDLDTCDRIVFDLDPGPDVEWRSVIAAAREIRERLEAHRLESFVKTSGGKGLHVMLPVEGAGWDAAKDFAHEIALGMAGDKPGLFTASMAKSKRTGRIFVDYLRNTRGASSVAAFSTRARAGAPVSAPLSWDELAPQRTADSITVASMPRRLSRLHSDPWADLPRTRQRLPAPR